MVHDTFLLDTPSFFHELLLSGVTPAFVIDLFGDSHHQYFKAV